MPRIQLPTRPAYCLVERPRPILRGAGNRKSPVFLSAAWMYSSTACRACSVSSNRTGLPRLLLTHRRSVDGVTVRRNVLDLKGDYIAATEFAVDGEVEH